MAFVMQFHSQLLPDGRFEIYEGSKLLATIGCPQACQEIVKGLQQRQVGQILDQSAAAIASDCLSQLERVYSCSNSRVEEARSLPTPQIFV